MKLDYFLKSVAIFVFVGLLPVLWFFPQNSNALVWTLVIPLIPIFWLVIGYSRFRRICPLAWISTIAQNSTLVKKRFASHWLIRNFYLLQFSLLVLAFSARHWFLNFNPLALAVFFLIVMFSAYLVGLFYSGKTWCNYICPVSFVEKVYAGSNSKKVIENSECKTCTACKTNCPDIDYENSYWKEQHLKQKRSLFYAFPGLVFGFYLYYYLRSGSWSSYFDGEWTHSQLGFLDAISSNGFYFLDFIPLGFAAPITLLLTSTLSYLIFLSLEKFLFKTRKGDSARAKNIYHVVMIIAGFTAFNTFYLFAGAPTFSHYPELYKFFTFFTLIVSTLWLAKEIYREERYYPQERFARRIIKKEKGKLSYNSNLKEIYYTYMNTQTDHKKHIELYSETLAELLDDGVLSKGELSVMKRIRQQFNISDTEHQKVMRKLKADQGSLAFGDEIVSKELLHKRKNYQKALRNILCDVSKLDHQDIEKIRLQFNITQDEHDIIVENILKTDTIFWENIETKNKQLNNLASIYANSIFDQSKESQYLKFVIKEAIEESIADIQYILYTIYKKKQVKEFIELLKFKTKPNKELFTQKLQLLDKRCHIFFQETYELLKSGKNPQAQNIKEDDLITLLGCGHDNLTAAILLYVYAKKLNSKDFSLNIWTHSSNKAITQIAHIIKTNDTTKLSDVEKLAYLHSVSTFSKLSSNALDELCSDLEYKQYKKDEDLVKEGEDGDSLYILTSGECSVNIKGKEVAKVKKADVIGEIAILSSEKRTATVTTLSDVDVLILKGKSFKQSIYKNPGLSLEILKDVTHRLLHNNDFKNNK